MRALLGFCEGGRIRRGFLRHGVGRVIPGRTARMLSATDVLSSDYRATRLDSKSFQYDKERENGYKRR